MIDDPAIEKMLQDLQNKPEDTETFHQLEEYFFLSSEWESLVLIYKIRAEHLEKQNPEESAQSFFKQGEF